MAKTDKSPRQKHDAATPGIEKKTVAPRRKSEYKLPIVSIWYWAEKDIVRIKPNDRLTFQQRVQFCAALSAVKHILTDEVRNRLLAIEPSSMVQFRYQDGIGTPAYLPKKLNENIDDDSDSLGLKWAFRKLLNDCDPAQARGWAERIKKGESAMETASRLWMPTIFKRDSSWAHRLNADFAKNSERWYSRAVVTESFVASILKRVNSDRLGIIADVFKYVDFTTPELDAIRSAVLNLLEPRIRQVPSISEQAIDAKGLVLGIRTALRESPKIQAVLPPHLFRINELLSQFNRQKDVKFADYQLKHRLVRILSRARDANPGTVLALVETVREMPPGTRVWVRTEKPSGDSPTGRFVMAPVSSADREKYSDGRLAHRLPVEFQPV